MNNSFKEVVDIKRWQKIQDHFAEVLRITLRTLDKEGNLITKPSYPSRFCDEIMRTTVEGMMRCRCHKPHYLSGIERLWKEGYSCPAGFTNFPIPIKISEETVAYFVVGPVLLGREKKVTDYQRISEELGVDPEKFLDVCREIRALSYNGIKSIIDLLYDISHYICQSGYQNIKLQGLTPAIPNVLDRVHEFYVERLLSSLLEVSCNFTEADRGSIMLLDHEKDELYIKIAKGLDKEVIERTRVKMGENLSGMVAKEGKPLFINYDIEDEKVIERLKNPDLKYAILMPIKLNDKLLGVLNIATSKTLSDKFTYQSLETIDKLSELVQSTIVDLPKISSQ